MTVQDVVDEVERNRAIYNNSKGGITLSGDVVEEVPLLPYHKYGEGNIKCWDWSKYLMPLHQTKRISRNGYQ